MTRIKDEIQGILYHADSIRKIGSELKEDLESMEIQYKLKTDNFLRGDVFKYEGQYFTLVSINKANCIGLLSDNKIHKFTQMIVCPDNINHIKKEYINDIFGSREWICVPPIEQYMGKHA